MDMKDFPGQPQTPAPLPQDPPSDLESPEEWWRKAMEVLIVYTTLQVLILIVAIVSFLVFVRRRKFGVRSNLVLL